MSFKIKTLQDEKRLSFKRGGAHSTSETIADFLGRELADARVSEKRQARLFDHLSTLIPLLAGEGSRARGNDGAFIDLSLSCLESQELKIEITNHGLPFLETDLSANGWKPSASAESTPGSTLFFRSSNALRMSFENLGRKGQKFSFQISRERSRAKQPELKSLDAPAPILGEDFIIRPIKNGDFPALSRLFYRVYGYNYINEVVYSPEKLSALQRNGKLISYVVDSPETHGELAAHLGMLCLRNDPSVYEMALGLTDPAIKARGLFSRLLQHLMSVSCQIPMSYALFEYVTNHDISQRMVGQYGTHDLALNAGCQLSETQARLSHLGLGTDAPDMDRYSILLGVKAQVENPFGHEVHLPIPIGEMLGFVLAPLGIEWTPSSRFDSLTTDGSYSKSANPFQKSVHFELDVPGVEAIRRLISEWRHLLKNDYQYCSVDIPINAKGLGQAFDLISSSGFFVAGFVPYKWGETLSIRLQSTGPQKIAFDDIKIASQTGKRLLEVVRESYERNRIL